jgi:hypothetical protein
LASRSRPNCHSCCEGTGDELYSASIRDRPPNPACITPQEPLRPPKSCPAAARTGLVSYFHWQLPLTGIPSRGSPVEPGPFGGDRPSLARVKPLPDSVSSPQVNPHHLDSRIALVPPKFFILHQTPSSSTPRPPFHPIETPSIAPPASHLEQYHDDHGEARY